MPPCPSLYSHSQILKGKDECFGQEGVGGETNLDSLLLASQVRLDPVAHSNDVKTSLKQLKL
jgi:hypothetical protein